MLLVMSRRQAVRILASRSWCGAVTLAATLGVCACHGQREVLCLDIFGPCGGPANGPGGNPPPYGVVGDYPHHVVSNSTVTIHVGESANLYLVRWRSDPGGSSDTVRTASWSMQDQTAAHLVDGTGGAGLLTAVAPGKVGSIQVTGAQSFSLWACDVSTCSFIDTIIVVQ